MRIEPLEGRCLLSGAGFSIPATPAAPGLSVAAVVVDRIAGIGAGAVALVTTLSTAPAALAATGPSGGVATVDGLATGATTPGTPRVGPLAFHTDPSATADGVEGLAGATEPGSAATVAHDLLRGIPAGAAAGASSGGVRIEPGTLPSLDVRPLAGGEARPAPAGREPAPQAGVQVRAGSDPSSIVASTAVTAAGSHGSMAASGRGEDGPTAADSSAAVGRIDESGAVVGPGSTEPAEVADLAGLVPGDAVGLARALQDLLGQSWGPGEPPPLWVSLAELVTLAAGVSAYLVFLNRSRRPGLVNDGTAGRGRPSRTWYPTTLDTLGTANA